MASKTVHTSAKLTATARLFSAAVIREFAVKGRSPLFARLAIQSGASGSVPKQATIRDFFDSAFQILRRKACRHEYVYKAALARKVLIGRHSLATAAMLTEFRVGASKADVVILNGTSTVYEIKSERDKLDRLEQQLASYLQVFDLVNVLTSANHLAAIEATAPRDVGILVLTDRFQISVQRPPQSDPERMRPLTVFESLQRREAQLVLERCGQAVPDVPNTLIHQSMRDVFGRLSPAQLHPALVEVLKASRSPLALRDFVEAVPESLQAAALSTRLGRRERVRLINSIRIPFGEALAWA